MNRLILTDQVGQVAQTTGFDRAQISRWFSGKPISEPNLAIFGDSYGTDKATALALIELRRKTEAEKRRSLREKGRD